MNRFHLFFASMLAALLDAIDERARSRSGHPLHGIPRHELPYFNQ